MSKVGFIGVGTMGGPMARNIAKGGHQVKAFDVNKQAVAALADAGIARRGQRYRRRAAMSTSSSPCCRIPSMWRRPPSARKVSRRRLPRTRSIWT